MPNHPGVNNAKFADDGLPPRDANSVSFDFSEVDPSTLFGADYTRFRFSNLEYYPKPIGEEKPAAEFCICGAPIRFGVCTAECLLGGL